MALIQVRKLQARPRWKFEVTIDDNGSLTKHIVTMDQKFYDDLKTEASPVEVVEESFRFLLEREPKEMIYKEFDISVISRYFPEYQDTIKRRPANKGGKGSD